MIEYEPHPYGVLPLGNAWLDSIHTDSMWSKDDIIMPAIAVPAVVKVTITRSSSLGTVVKRLTRCREMLCLNILHLHICISIHPSINPFIDPPDRHALQHPHRRAGPRGVVSSGWERSVRRGTTVEDVLLPC